MRLGSQLELRETAVHRALHLFSGACRSLVDARSTLEITETRPTTTFNFLWSVLPQRRSSVPLVFLLGRNSNSRPRTNPRPPSLHPFPGNGQLCGSAACHLDSKTILCRSRRKSITPTPSARCHSHHRSSCKNGTFCLLNLVYVTALQTHPPFTARWKQRHAYPFLLVYKAWNGYILWEQIGLRKKSWHNRSGTLVYWIGNGASAGTETV